ncbi:hypothetical protein Cgig2_022574 [Carnegiea gigantea]|uniref:Peptidyl-tRNA hydrolase n=1 Tax=Carnegiea gigantea TaxID=171969 RepID=A0A9Q1KKA7_9CARY|nr:hypothetical protein Cgig2_022574 [Carnegiea gigantea]
MLRRLIGGNSCHVRCFGTTSSSSAVPPLPWLFVGLGNPGQKFMGTRHNVGFEMVDAFADAIGISVDTVHCKALFGQGFVGNVPLFLAKPQTYMNLSGESVSALSVELSCIWLKSVIDHFRGNREFARLRIGIGRPPGQMDPKAFLLQKFNSLARERVQLSLERVPHKPADTFRIDAALKEAVDMLKLIPTEGLAECARWFNREQKYKHIQTTIIKVEGEANHPGA